MPGCAGSGAGTSFGGSSFFFSIFSALLTLGHDFADRHEVFSKDAVAAADFIRDNTPPDALFLSSNFHNNPVTALAGRTIVAGYVAWLVSFGLDYEQRFADIRAMYTEPARFPGLQEKYAIDYVYYSDYEKSQYERDPEYFDETYPKIFSQGPIRIYAVSERARNFVRVKPVPRQIPVPQVP